MNTQSPAEVLNALARGINPASGERLEASGIWQQVVIAEALRAGAAALEQHPPHVRAPSAANVGQPWTPQEEHDLLTSFAAGTALPAYSARNLRTSSNSR